MHAREGRCPSDEPWLSAAPTWASHSGHLRFHAPSNAEPGSCHKPHAVPPRTPWRRPLPGRRLRSNRPRGADGQLGRDLQPPVFRFADLRFRSSSSSRPVDRQGFACKPREGALGAFAKAVDQAQHILVAPFVHCPAMVCLQTMRGGPDNHQHTLAIVFAEIDLPDRFPYAQTPFGV